MGAGKMQTIMLQEAIWVAQSYFEIGEDIYTTIDKAAIMANPKNRTRSIVGYSNSAFAAEVGLKVLVYVSGNPVETFGKIHYLDSLFKLLSGTNVYDIIQTRAIEIVNLKQTYKTYNEDDFQEDLKCYRDGFVQGRYWYEVPNAGSKGKQAGQLFMYAFSKAIVEQLVDLERDYLS